MTGNDGAGVGDRLVDGMDLALDMLSSLPTELVREVISGSPALTALLVEDQGCAMMLSEHGLVDHALTVLEHITTEHITTKRITASYPALLP